MAHVLILVTHDDEACGAVAQRVEVRLDVGGRGRYEVAVSRAGLQLCSRYSRSVGANGFRDSGVPCAGQFLVVQRDRCATVVECVLAVEPGSGIDDVGS
ncbi:hypothetical protein [Williamsia sp.]|uniref:hypothetical protein n=1 Tax=Williamsia sp. TaxID=1872085 RepID=UPI0025CE9BF3|nr:hypothetical protein [Williamsia sp.]